MKETFWSAQASTPFISPRAPSGELAVAFWIFSITVDLPLNGRLIIAPHPGKEPVLGAELVLRPGFLYLPVAHDVDAVGVHNGREPVGDHDNGLTLGKLLKRCLYLGLIVGVCKGRCLVKDKHWRVFQHRAGNGVTEPSFGCCGSSLTGRPHDKAGEAVHVDHLIARLTICRGKDAAASVLLFDDLQYLFLRQSKGLFRAAELIHCAQCRLKETHTF